MFFDLQARGSVSIPQNGQTIVYLSGEKELLFTASKDGVEVSRFSMPSGGQVTLSKPFDSIAMTNLDDQSQRVEVAFYDGEYQRLSDVSFIQIQGITNTVEVMVQNQKLNAEVLNQLDIRPITETLDIRPITETLDIRPITETLDIRQITETLDIRQITETLKNRPDSGALFSAVNHVFDSSGVVEIPTNSQRKELNIIADDANTNPISINGFELLAGDQFSLDDFSGALTVSGVENQAFQFLEVLYAN